MTLKQRLLSFTNGGYPEVNLRLFDCRSRVVDSGQPSAMNGQSPSKSDSAHTQLGTILRICAEGGGTIVPVTPSVGSQVLRHI